VIFWNERLTSLAALRVSLFRHLANSNGQFTSEGYGEDDIVSGPRYLSLSEVLHKPVRLIDAIWRSAEHNSVIHLRCHGEGRCLSLHGMSEFCQDHACGKP
jgi:hypothetical protein